MKYTPIFSFIGSSGSGKTTFLEKLIPILKNKGLSLGVIKHDAHQFEIDKPGKDSYRFKSAGADIVAISSSEKMAIVKSFTKKEETLEEIVLNYFKDVDMILTEGYKKSSIPKIEIFRQEVKKPFISADKLELIGVITDSKECPRKDVKKFNLDCYNEVAEYLIDISIFDLPEIEVINIEDNLLKNSLSQLFGSYRFLKRFHKVKITVEIEE
jgi:molybdopterin-guanine dinucleotide biosynthesis protein B